MKPAPRDPGELYAVAYEAGRKAALEEFRCCALDALRAEIANSEGRYIGGYHGTENTAIKAEVTLTCAMNRHPEHALTQPDRKTP